jgi:hypothetical protein
MPGEAKSSTAHNVKSFTVTTTNNNTTNNSVPHDVVASKGLQSPVSSPTVLVVLRRPYGDKATGGASRSARNVIGCVLVYRGREARHAVIGLIEKGP